MRRCRENLPNRCYHLISRVARRAFEGVQAVNRKGRAAMTSKTRCGNLLWCLTLLPVVFMVAGCLFVGAAEIDEKRASADVAWTDVETVTDYLTNTLHAAVSDVRVYTSSEAVPLVDRYFALEREEDCPDPARRLRWMKHLLENEFAFVYSFSASADGLKSEDEEDEGKVSGDISVYVFQPRVFSWFDIETDPPRMIDLGRTNIGLRAADCADYVVFSKADGRRLDFFIMGIGDAVPEGQLLPFRNRKFEAEVRAPELDTLPDDNEPVIPEGMPDVIAIADVESVFFDSVRNMNPSCVKNAAPNSQATISPVATYRVELLVRRVEKGAFRYERLAFVVDPSIHPSLYEVWPFYRGMTLGVALCRTDGALRVRRVWPVLPYPPFSSSVRTSAYPIDRRCAPLYDSRFSINARAVDLKPDGAKASLAVQYGEHTLAKFIARFNGIEGMYGEFPDYSCGVEVEVWTASEGANPDYWRDAWFASPWNQPMRSSEADDFCMVQNAEEGLDDLALLKFRWKPCRVDDRMRKVKTLGDFAEFIDAATTCVECGRRHYKVSVDPSVAAREAKFSVLLPGDGVFGALEDVCENTGCEFKVDGTNVVISAWLTESEIADVSLQGRLRILEKAGFASVAGAQYAEVSFWRRDMRDGAAKPLEQPMSFYSLGDYGTTGSGWIRTTADGKSETLAFDSSWWPSDGGFYPPEKARLLRDVAKVRAYLRDAAEDSNDARHRWREPESDRYALAFALHVHQVGYAEEAQSLFDALNLRPDAAFAAFTSLLAKVREANKDYPDFKTWLEKSLDPREKNKEGSTDDDE